MSQIVFAQIEYSGNTNILSGNTNGNTNSGFLVFPSSSILFQMSPKRLHCSTLKLLLRTGYKLKNWIVLTLSFSERRQAL